MKDHEIKHVKTAVASPWANGQVERVNRFLKSTLSKIVEEPSSWVQSLEKTQFVINNTVNKAINSTPSKMLLGYDQRHKTDNELCEMIKRLTKIEEEYSKEREEVRDAAQLVNRSLQKYNKTQYDKRHKKSTKYKTGDLVMVKVLHQKPGVNKKLVPRYKGPYQIKAALSKNRYVVTDVPGYNLSQKPLNTIVSPDKLKPWIRVNLGRNVEDERDTDQDSNESIESTD